MTSVDVPHYDRRGHVRLGKNSIADSNDPLRPTTLMACHKSKDGHEFECAGWLFNQLTVGNNVWLRMQARDGRYADLVLDGEQRETFEESLT